MTFLELYGDALDIELSTSDRTNLFTTARRKKAINDAQKDFARLTGCTKRYGTITVTDGVGEADVYTTLTDFTRFAGDPSVKITSGSTITYIQGLDAFPKSTPEELDRLSPSWRAATAGTPVSWYVREDGGHYYLGMTPAPDISGSDTWVWVVPYIARPADMSGDSEEPFTFSSTVMTRLRDYHQALVHRAAADLVLLRKDTTEHLRQMQLYSGLVAQFLQTEREDSQDVITYSRNYLAEQGRVARGIDIRRYP